MTDRMRALWPGDVAPWERDELEIDADRPPVPWMLLAIVFVAAVAAWWPYPGTAYWKSDDFLAVVYASDLDRALGDFVHRQYDLGGLVTFYRPLITLSFALEQLVAGVDPLVSHASNAVAQGVSAVLVASIASRFVAPLGAALCGLVWATMPSHAGAVLWAVGRVDSHTTVWALLAVLAVLRHIERRRLAGLLAAAAFTAALCSKEFAVVVPIVAMVCGFALGAEHGRVRTAWDVSWPLFVLLAIYLAWRLVAFGEVGGYGGVFRPGPALAGFGLSAVRLANPLAWAGSVPDAVRWLGYAPVAVALVGLAAGRRFGLLAGLVLLFVVGCAPLYALLEHADNLVNLRYFHAPAVALALLLAAGGRVASVLALAVWALPFVGLREDWAAQSSENRAAHRLLLDAAPDLRGETVFVGGLPRRNAKGTALAFHVGPDRLLQPPFTERGIPTYALRALSDAPEAFRVPYGDGVGLPFGATLELDGTRILAQLVPAPVPRLDVDVLGSTVLGSRRIYELAAQRDDTGSVEGTTFLIAGRDHGTTYRFTLFTGMGYLSTVVEDRDGRIDLVFDLLWFEFAPGSTDRWAQALRGPASIDLVPRFPLLVEAGRLVQLPGGGAVFERRAAAREPVWIELDRGYADLMAGRVPRAE